RADAGIVRERNVRQAEAEQTVDLILIEDALGAAFAALQRLAVVDHRRPLGGGFLTGPRGLFRRGAFGLGVERLPPFGGERVLIDLVLAGHQWLTGRRFL